MTENLLNSLIVTLIGMGITFVAIIVLWWMMAGLTAFPVKEAAAESAPEPVPAEAGQLKAKAAAAAVALALAEQELSSARPLQTPPTALVSAWQLGTRTRQLYERGSQRRQLGPKR
jgi:Na+-transporting methylmalonyl-CoA/oxaloacetate decarboxylase gamma subunit